MVGEHTIVRIVKKEKSNREIYYFFFIYTIIIMNSKKGREDWLVYEKNKNHM